MVVITIRQIYYVFYACRTRRIFSSSSTSIKDIMSHNEALSHECVCVCMSVCVRVCVCVCVCLFYCKKFSLKKGRMKVFPPGYRTTEHY